MRIDEFKGSVVTFWGKIPRAWKVKGGGLILVAIASAMIDYLIGVNLTNISGTAQIIHKLTYMVTGVAIWNLYG